MDALDGTYTIHVGDAEDVAGDLTGFHAVLCDPPYGLSFMSKGWDHSVPGPSLWRSVASALLPGAHVLAFGGTRTYHRLTCAIENAGFEIRDCLMWLYGSGFPKSHNIGDGYGTALKPAWEPCILARNPLGGTVADNVIEHGCGALNIDGARVGSEGGTKSDGRWPANVIFDADAGARLDAQTGELTSGSRCAGEHKVFGGGITYGETFAARLPEVEGSTGGASRFFYCAKASRTEREAGLSHREASNVNDGRETSIDNPYQRGDTQRQNIHPTVKPVDLCRYLATLLLPPPGDTVRRILVPFSGAGSEMIGCLLAGWDEVVGIELNAEYAGIARDRLAHWKKWGQAKSEAAQAESAGQESLF